MFYSKRRRPDKAVSVNLHGFVFPGPGSVCAAVVTARRASGEGAGERRRAQAEGVGSGVIADRSWSGSGMSAGRGLRWVTAADPQRCGPAASAPPCMAPHTEWPRDWPGRTLLHLV